jgi:4-hydroxybenzoate polyprenyltransferase
MKQSSSRGISCNNSQMPRFSLYLRLARFDRPVGTLLLLWPTLWALWLSAEGSPEPVRLLVFVAGVVLMRAAGCVVNDIADRRFDLHVKRTAQRVLTTGELSVGQAAGFGLILFGLSVGLLLFLNTPAITLAVMAAVIAACYPLFKRFFPLPQLVLGLAFSFGIPMTYADTLGHIPITAWLLFAGNLFWVLAYDTAYAMVDRDDDLRLGLHSSAIAFGRFDAYAVVCSQALFLICLGLVFYRDGLGPIAWFGWCIACAYSLVLLRSLGQRDREGCFVVFTRSHRVGLILWLGVVLHYESSRALF